MRRAQVINAALECLAEKGFEELTLDIVADKAGVSKGILMYYFENKKDLLLQSFRAFLEYYNEVVEAVVTPKMSAEEMLDLFIVLAFENGGGKHNTKSSSSQVKIEYKTYSSGIKIEQGMMSRLFVHFYSKTLTDSDFQNVLNDVYKTYYKGMRQILRYGRLKREFRKVDTRIVSYGLMALADGMLLYKVLGFQPIKEAEIVETWKTFTRSLLK
jgi:TetR/AcrR family transcriptional repressor of bet genes